MNELLVGSRKKPKSDITIFVLQETKETQQNLGSSCAGSWPNNYFCSFLLGHRVRSHLPSSASRLGHQ